MPSVITSLALALGQLTDRKVLRILAKSLAVTIAAFLAIAWAGWHAIDWGLAQAGLGETLFAGAGGLRSFASALLALTGLWLTWRIVAMAVIQFFADEVVQAVEARHYPQQAGAARELSFAGQARHGGAAALRALLVNLIALPFALALLFTGIGTALLFWLVNALLLGRELQDMVWLRHRRDARDLSPVGSVERFLLGGAVAAMLALPFVNFLAPLLGAAAATHLVHRKGDRSAA